MRHIVVYQGKTFDYETEAEVWAVCLILRRDGIEFELRLEMVH